MLRILLRKKPSPYIPVGAFAASLLTLRKHTLTYSGRMRDTVYFSILDDEWPAVKAGLETKLRHP